MLRSLSNLRGYTIRATDGDIGKIHDFYFDDWLWTIRYLVVDAGNWLSDRRVVLSPLSVKQPDWYSHALPVELTKEQVKLSPPVSTEGMITPQMENDLSQYFNWLPFWRSNASDETGPAGVTLPAAPKQAESAAPSEESQGQNARLRSMNEVIGYNIQARNGKAGYVEDFIIEDEVWTIYYVVVNTSNGLPGKKVLVSLQWIEKVSWEEKSVFVDLQRETVEGSPVFDPTEAVNREYELMLYDYYGKPQYWVKTQ